MDTSRERRRKPGYKMGDEPVRLPLDTFAVQNWLSAHGHDV